MKLVVGNQKMYLNRREAEEFIENTKEGNCNNAIVCPSSLYLDLYLEKSKYNVGGQDVSINNNGACTGDVSASQLLSMGATYCIVGHSERRANYHENSELIFNKISRLLENDITPIFCIGEHLEEKERNVTKDVVGKQIMEVYDKLDKEKMEKIIIAYEPIWSIGTGKIPTNQDIEDVTNYIKDLVLDKYGKRTTVLYGGSVNMKNVDTLNQIEVVDGYLIGGASTKPDEFLYIMRKCE